MKIKILDKEIWRKNIAKEYFTGALPAYHMNSLVDLSFKSSEFQFFPM